MIELAILAVLATATVTSSPHEGERSSLATLPTGQYECSVPGDAAGAARRPYAAYTFAVRNGSIYATSGGSGTYLLIGQSIAFTSGPLKGTQMRQEGARTVRLLDEEGRNTRVRCTIQGR